jgi:hypothetical protein
MTRNELARSTFAGNNRGLFEFVSERRDARDCDGLLSMSWNMGEFIAAVEASDEETQTVPSIAGRPNADQARAD